MRPRILVAVSLAVVVALPVFAGCRMIKVRLGIGDTITTPDPGTPEKVIQDVLKAARMADDADAWQAFAFLLHSSEASSPAGMNEWQTMRFPAMRRKVDYLLLDRTALTYKLMDKREDGKDLRIFVANSQSDTPTPCTLRQDPGQGNAWRVYNSCF